MTRINTKTSRLLILTLTLVAPAMASTQGMADELSAGFQQPPDACKPRTWWHWMNGHVTKEAITRDIEDMKRIGLGGFTLWNTHEGIPKGPVEYASEEWWNLLQYTIDEAERLGLQVDMNNDAGWCGSGGGMAGGGHYRLLKSWPQWLRENKSSPSGRLTFTTARYHKKDDPLLSSGLLGPVALCTSSCLLTNLAQCAEKALPITGGEVFMIQDRTAFLILPEKGKSDAPIPWIWYAPTLRGLPGKAEQWMFEQFMENGIAIAGVDVGESYGSPEGRTVYSALYKYLVEHRGLARKACLLARSRGGLMLYNWAVEHPESVACIAGIYPVCNLSSYPGLDRACGAYGMSRQELMTTLTEHNPIDRLAALARAKVPIFHLHGDSDTVVPLARNSAVVKARYEKLGGKMTLEVVKGQGHNMWPGWFHSRRLVDFVITHAREHKTTTAIDSDQR